MNRILITGALGFLGQHLCRALRTRGDFVVRLVRDHVCARDHAEDAGLASAIGDLTSVASMERILAEYELDTVVHLAAQVQVSVAKADPIGTMDANVRGTLAVLEACRRQGIRRVVVASSDKHYGAGPVPYREEQAPTAGGIYATSKAMADLATQSYALEYNLPVAIVRSGNLYGPGHLNFSALIPDAIRCALQGKTLAIRSDGKAQRDYLYAGDAVDGYLRLIDSGVTGAWNFGTEKPLSVMQVVSRVGEVVGVNVSVDVQNRAAGEIQDQWLDCTKARTGIGWAPKYPELHAGLQVTVPWYREYLGV